MLRCNSTGQGRRRFCCEGGTIGRELEWCNFVLDGMFEVVCRGGSTGYGRYVLRFESSSTDMENLYLSEANPYRQKSAKSGFWTR